MVVERQQQQIRMDERQRPRARGDRRVWDVGPQQFGGAYMTPPAVQVVMARVSGGERVMIATPGRSRFFDAVVDVGRQQHGGDYVMPGGGTDNKLLVARVSGGERATFTPPNALAAKPSLHFTLGGVDLRGSDSSAIARIDRLQQQLPEMVVTTILTALDSSPAVAAAFRR